MWARFGKGEDAVQYSVVTGATSGLGLAYTEILANEGRNLILIARNSLSLQDLAQRLAKRHGIAVLTFPCDLSNQESLSQLVAKLKVLEIDILINNAGFGIYDSFESSDLENELKLINLTIIAPMTLCHELVAKIACQDAGLVINVGSIAGYLSASTYSAAKSWIKVFTEALAFEYRKLDINICCVAPGYIDTNFQNASGNSKAQIPKFLVSDPMNVAKKSLQSARKGKIVCVPALKNRCIAIFIQYAPRPLVRSLSSLR